MNEPTKTEIAPDDLAERAERVIIKGDLSGIKGQEALAYYKRVCDSVGLNPYTKPFEFIRLNNKLVLYALKGATDQLRMKYGISVKIVSQEIKDGYLTVHAQATMPNGRVDEDYGVMPLPDKMQGEIRSNKIMHCVTKAKRRVTLSICGLGMLDETEVDSIPDGAKRETEFMLPKFEAPEGASEQ
jgi:hypothetical protein